MKELSNTFFKGDDHILKSFEKVMIDALNVKHNSSDGGAWYCYCIRYSSNPLKLQYILCPFNFGSFCKRLQAIRYVARKEGEKVLLGKLNDKEN